MFTSERGFYVIELLIALAISGIVTAGLYGMAISSSRYYVSQNGVIGLQADGRAAMEFMARDLRQAFGSPTLATTVTTNDTISFNRVEDSGRASGGSTTTLTDILKAWTPGALAPTATSAQTLRIIAGTGAGQTRTITANTATQITVAPALGTTPDTSSLYVITTMRAFTKTSATDHTVRYRVSATGDNDPPGREYHQPRLRAAERHDHDHHPDGAHEERRPNDQPVPLLHPHGNHQAAQYLAPAWSHVL